MRLTGSTDSKLSLLTRALLQSSFERFNQLSLVGSVSPANVDIDSVGLHGAESCLVDESLSVLARWQGVDDHVRGRVKRVEVRR